MHSIEVFCIDCGALNQAQGVSCFACGAPLPADADAAAANYIDPDQFIPGNLFKGRYRILSQVGSGGFGAVYKARDIQENDRLVAIKVIHLRGLKPREVIEATDTFNREVMMLSSLKSVEIAYQDYLAGRLNETPVPQADVSRDKGRGDFRQAPQLKMYYYAMNFLVKPFDNIHIRQAFALALNRDELAHAVWQDSVLPTNTLVPRGMENYGSFLHGSDGIYSTLGDPTKAAMLLQQGMSEEGYSSLAQLPTITFTYHSTSQASSNEVTVDLLRWQRVLGVHVHADPVKNGDRFASEVSHSAHNSHGLQMWADSFTADYPDLHDVLTRQFDKNSPYNISNYGQNTSSDAAQQQDVQLQLEAADLNSNATTRLQAYQQAEQQLLNDVAWLPMFQVTGNVLIQPHVQGMVLGSLPFIFPDDWANVYIGTPPVG